MMNNTILQISALGPLGDGLHRERGKNGPIFVERSAPGDRIRARVFTDSLGVRRAKPLEILSRSPSRANPPCRHFETCGNCSLQHLKIDYYRRWKIESVRTMLLKVGIRPREWLAPVFVEDGSRRRLTFTATRRRERLEIGYYERRSQRIVIITECRVAHPRIFAVKERLVEFLNPWVRDTANIFIQLADNAMEVILTGPFDWIKDSDFRAAARRFAIDYSGSRGKTGGSPMNRPIVRIGWRPDESRAVRVVFASAPLLRQFGKLSVELPPGAFLQATNDGEEAIVSTVLAHLPKRGRFLDLFSGSGTLTGSLAKLGQVDAFDSNPSAVLALAASGRDSGVRAVRRDLFRNPITTEALNRYDAVVLDPPRSGALAQVSRLSRSRVPVVAMVSCNPATFARDAFVLSRGGFRLHAIRVIDQFQWSHHIELVGNFQKEKVFGNP